MSYCDKAVSVQSDDPDVHADLVCSLPAGHAGPLHHDGVDGIWWALDDGARKGANR